MKTLIIIYRIAATLLTLLCLYGIYSILSHSTNPAQYGLSALSMSAGFVCVALVGWLPLLLRQMKKHHPGSVSIEETLARAGQELHDLATEQTPRKDD